MEGGGEVAVSSSNNDVPLILLELRPWHQTKVLLQKMCWKPAVKTLTGCSCTTSLMQWCDHNGRSHPSPLPHMDHMICGIMISWSSVYWSHDLLCIDLLGARPCAGESLPRQTGRLTWSLLEPKKSSQLWRAKSSCWEDLSTDSSVSRT